MTSLHSTHSQSLNFKHEENFFSLGFCLSEISFDDLFKTYDKFLHKEEKAYFLQLQYLKRQHSYLLGRYCAKHAISRYNKTKNFTEVWIENGIFNHPVVLTSNGNTQVSISHTEKIGVAIAFPETYPMGIDIETISSKNADIIRSHLSPSELNLNMFGTRDAHLAFLWTAKEALSKVLKCGLTLPFYLLEINSAKKLENITISDFKNFKQYKAISFCSKNFLCSLVCPQGAKLESQILALEKALKNGCDTVLKVKHKNH